MLKNPAIRDRDYRRLFAGAAFHQQGMAGEQVVLGLLVIQLMGSSAWVGYTLAAYFTPFFVFGLVSGAITDWTDRRTLLRRIEIATAATLACPVPRSWREGAMGAFEGTMSAHARI